jgi:ACS family tartrate transporter-like MFS transporter
MATTASRAIPDSTVEARTMRRVAWRLVPFLIVCYFVAYLDRVNIGFAKLAMDGDLGISETVYGQAAGIFFLAYFIFEVPSNLLLDRFGARKWIARIMLTWGILSGAMAVVGGVKSLLAVRFLLGLAEAGFFPGIIFYLTLWFPAAYRGRIVGYFMAAIPMSGVIGGPVSGYLLGLDGVLGLRGWQWLFICEAVPALVLSVVVFFYLTDRPADATWLQPDERAWLANRLDLEQRQREAAAHFTVAQALLNPKVLALAFVYFGGVACNYGVGFFIPQLFKNFGLTDVQTGWLTAVPFAVGAATMVWWGMRSDRTGERKGPTAIALAVAAVGIGGSTFFTDPAVKVLLLSFGAMGVFGCLPVFWTLPTTFLSGPAAAGGIAIINALGNLSGYFGPAATGKLKDMTGSYSAGFLLMAALALLAMIIVLVLPHDARLERAPVPAE